MAKSPQKSSQSEEPPALNQAQAVKTVAAAPEAPSGNAAADMADSATVPAPVVESKPAPLLNERGNIEIRSPWNLDENGKLTDKPLEFIPDPAVMARASWEGQPPPKSDPEEEDDDDGDFPRCDWQVTLRCPTPIAAHQLTIKARTSEEARDKFFAHNGISGSDHPLDIQKLELASV